MADVSRLYEALKNADAAGDVAAAQALAAEIRKQESVANSPEAMGETLRAAEPPRPKNTVGIDSSMMFTRGAMMGLTDYPSAAVNYLVDRAFGKKPTYNESLKEVRQSVEAYRDENPVKAYGMEIAGGVTSPLFSGIYKGVDAGISALSQQVSQAFPRAGAALASRWVGYGLQGAAAGAAAGAGNAQGEGGGVPTMGDLAQQTGTGAAIGGALGVAIPAVAEGGKWIGGKLLDIAQPGLDRLPGNQPSAAGRRLARAAARDNMGPDDIRAAMDAMGPDATMADVGPNLKAVVRSSAQQPGNMLTAATETYGARQEGQGARVVEKLAANLDNRDFGQTFEQQLATRSKLGNPAYTELFQKYPDVRSPFLQNLMENEPLVQQGLKEGLDSARIAASRQGQKFDPTVLGVTDFNAAGDPIIGPQSRSTLQMWDTVKQGLDRILNSGDQAIRNPMTGKLTGRGNDINGLRQSIVDHLDEATGNEYKAVRGIWAGPSRAMEMMHDGIDFIKTGRSSLDVAAVNKLPSADKDFMRIGAKQALQDMVANTPDGSNVVRRVFGNQMMRDKLKALFPSEQAFNTFAKEMGTESTMFRTGADVLGGSQTKFLQAAAADDASDMSGAIVNLATGRPGSFVTGVLRSLAAGLTRPSAAVADQMTPMVSTDKAVQDAFLNLMRQRAQVGGMLGGQPGAITGALSQPPGAFVGPLMAGGSNQ